MSEELTGTQFDPDAEHSQRAAEQHEAALLGETLQQAMKRDSSVREGSDSLQSQPIAPFTPVAAPSSDAPDSSNSDNVTPLFDEHTASQTKRHDTPAFRAATFRSTDFESLDSNSAVASDDGTVSSDVTNPVLSQMDTALVTNSALGANTAQKVANLRAQDFSSADDEVAQVDPLMKRPRLSTILWCVVLAIGFLTSAVALWFMTVRTVAGQSYEEMLIDGFGTQGVPSWLAFLLRPICNSITVVALGIILAVVALVIVCVRKRWWLLGQCAAIIVVSAAAEPLKKILPRPLLVHIEYLAANSAPSGHALLISAACALLVCAVSRRWRAWVALLSAVVNVLVELSLIAGHWHRSADVLMSVLIVGAVTLGVLACTRSSGMDNPEHRCSSMGVQIVGSSMITLGVLSCLYSAYLIWQIMPGVSVAARWASNVSYIATYWVIIGITLLVYGVIMVMRHATAAPLSRLGLVGAPPTPPPAA